MASDKFSNLPDEVMDKILMFLPIREAVKTCVLSTNWRYKWTSIPNLVFDTRSIPSHIKEREQLKTNLVTFVDKTLLLHNDIISNFILNNFLESGCADVDQWILSLSRKMLNHLALLFKSTTNTYQIPSCLFSCQTLKNLELEGCKIILPSQYQGFSNLTDLRLEDVILTNQTFESLLVKIPHLYRLSIIHCKSLTDLIIDAPNLDWVVLVGDLIQSTTFRNAPKVTRTLIYLPMLPIGSKFDEAFGGLNSTLQCIGIILDPFLELLPNVIVSKRLKTTYNNLTSLSCWINFEVPGNILGLLCLCRSSPHLERITIAACWHKSESLDKEDSWEVQLCKEDGIFHCLKTVGLERFMGVKYDMGFIEFILLNAIVLETFYIKWEEKSVMDENVDAVKKISQFQKASSNAKVIFFDEV
ncbi:hypothetical protein AQUCO_01000382v1 [Aquilegia coerulea]|uniref:F-box domain-containing protein n=1 Tax=Aquilegia coerulea TaxID=218851 RepID=A0A2G5E9P0_AQUCA|nr:hypothetical protein AQUCO_01000382v1 [Aquilegia coerulea]